jgi:hypothetical protein
VLVDQPVDHLLDQSEAPVGLVLRVERMPPTALGGRPTGHGGTDEGHDERSPSEVDAAIDEGAVELVVGHAGGAGRWVEGQQVGEDQRVAAGGVPEGLHEAVQLVRSLGLAGRPDCLEQQ